MKQHSLSRDGNALFAAECIRHQLRCVCTAITTREELRVQQEISRLSMGTRNVRRKGGSTMDEWISVKERLPEDGKVLCVRKS